MLRPYGTIHQPAHAAVAAVAAAVAVAGLATGTPTASHAQPTLIVSPSNPTPGLTVLLTVTGFPGGYDATIRFDGVEDGSFSVPASGSRVTAYPIPSWASFGAHVVTVCSFCDSYEFEHAASMNIAVTTGTLGPGEINYQVLAIEVTQGVRGPIPQRSPPAGNFYLPSDGAVHVANRRTIVRVYPWVEAAEAGFDAPVLIQLWGSIDGVEHGPLTTVAGARADRTIDQMRADPIETAEFVLPDNWVALATSQGNKTIDFRATINPDGGGECAGCDTDNSMILAGQLFRHVGRNNFFAFTFRPFLVDIRFTDAAGDSVILPRPTLGQLAETVRSFHDVLPIAEGTRGFRLKPWVYIDWRSPPVVGDSQVLDEAMVRRFLPTGRFEDNPPNDYYGFLQGPSGCGGHARLASPYFRANACGAPSYSAAHELGHCIGQSHAGNGHGEAGGGGYDPEYPGSHGQVEPTAWGMDVYTQTVKHPIATPSIFGSSSEDARHDNMSYGPHPKWTSRYVWDRVAELLGSPDIQPKAPLLAAGNAMAAAPPPAGSLGKRAAARRLVTGQIDADGLLALSPFFFAPGPASTSANGPYLLRFRDGNGLLLLAHAPLVTGWMDLDPQPASLIVEAVDVPAAWATLELFDGQNVTQSWARTQNPPQVAMLSPQAGFQWAGQGTAVVQWSGSDADQDALTYRVLGTPDGQTFHVLASDVRDSFAHIDLAAVPGSGMWEVLVEVSDGFDAALSAPVTGWIAPKPPRSLIVRPAEGSTHLQSDTIDAYGIAADWEDDAVGDGMVWLLDGQAAGLGVHAQLSDLAPGQHLLQLVTSNQFNLQGSMAITFEIVADLQPPQPLQPPDGAQSVQSPVVLTWAGVPAGVSYRVQVASDASFTWIVAEAGGLVSSQSTFHRAQLGRTYWWRVRTEHPTAPSAWSAAFAFSTQEHPTAIDLASPASSNLRLRAHPNPFNPRTTIEYSLELEGDLQLAVFDVAGRHVRTLAAGPAQAGTHSVEWDGRNAAGRPVGSGVYLVRLESATATRVVRVSLLR